MNAFGIDFHDPLWPYLKDHMWQFKTAGMTFVIWKGPMGLGNSPKAFLDEVNAYAKDAGLLRGIYGWIDPIYPIGPQLDRFKGLIDLYNPDFVCGDYEQWWASWDEYWAYLNGKISGNQVTVLSPTKVAQFGHDYMRGLKSFGKPTLLYTAKWFVDGYVGNTLLSRITGNPDLPRPNIARAFSNMENEDYNNYGLIDPRRQPVPMNVWMGLAAGDKLWMADYDLWEADYWNKLKDKMTFYDWKAFYDFRQRIIDLGPMIPVWKTRTMRQWSSVITLPNVKYGIRTDMDDFIGTEEQMIAYIGGYAPPPPPPPPPPPAVQSLDFRVVAPDGVNIRRDHVIGDNIADGAPLGTILKVVDIWSPGDVWLKLQDGKWACAKYKGTTLIIKNT